MHGRGRAVHTGEREAVGADRPYHPSDLGQDDLEARDGVGVVVLEELEHKYQLTFGFKTNDEKSFLILLFSSKSN